MMRPYGEDLKIYCLERSKKTISLVEAEFDPAWDHPVRAFISWSQMDSDFFSFEVGNFASTQQPRH